MNRRHLRVFAASLASAAALAGCGLLSPDTSYIILVDSVKAPDSIGVSEPLVARYFGWVGPNGCYFLRDVKRTRLAGSVTMKFVGDQDGDGCTHGLVPLDFTDTLGPPYADPFEIRIVQPDQSVLVRPVIVR